jgi:hypothetical protein
MGMGAARPSWADSPAVTVHATRSTSGNVGRRTVVAIVLLATLGIALLACASAVRGLRAQQQCTRYAAPHGSDRGEGSRARPYRTAQRLASALAPGQTGCLREGVYVANASSGFVLRMTRGGRRAAPITIRSAPGERARLRGIVALQPQASNVTLAQLTIVGRGVGNTIKFYGSDQALFDSYVTNKGRGLSCLLLGNPEYPPIRRPVVRGNTFRDCGDHANGNKDHAIYAADVVAGEIVDNVIASPAAYAIQFYPDAHRTRFAHNVIDGGRSIRGGIVFGGDRNDASSDNVVEYNVIAYAATSNVGSSWGGPRGTGNVARNNCLWAAREANVEHADGFVAVHNRIASPEFVNRAGHDYRLGPGSRCLAVVQYDTARRSG